MKRIANYLIALAVAAFTFTSCADVPSPFGDIVKPASGDVVVIEPSGTGTEADPYNVAGVLEYISGLGADTPSPKEVYIQGYAVELTDISASYGNATFTMSDNADGTANKFTVYRAAGLGNQKVTDESFIKQGDMVVVCGKVTNYKGNTPETVQGAAYVYSVNGKGGGATPAEETKTVTVAEFLAAPESTNVWYQMTGTVKNLKDGDEYGNFDIDDGTGSVYLYGLLSEKGGEKKHFQELATAKGIKNGSKLTIIGNRGSYNGVNQVVNAYFVKVEDGGSSDSNLGTKDAPLTVAKALEIINALADGGETTDAYVKGTISQVTSYNSTYKSITYYISDDGKTTSELQVYSGKGLNGAEFAAKEDLSVGDQVVIKGKLKKYVKNGNVTPEINQSSEIVSIVKASGGGSETGGAKGSGTLSDPYNVAAITEICSKLGDKEVSSQDYYIKGKICSVKYTFSAQFGTSTFNISDDGNTGGTEFTAYSVLYYNMASWVEGNTQIAVGDDVILFGKITNYGGTLETSSKKACIYSLNGKTGDSGSGGGNEGGNTGGNEIKAAFGDLDCSNIAAIKLSDGTTLSVTQEDGKSAPIYHENTKIIRIYARNAITINAGSKKISKVVFDYDTYNGTAYKGNDEMYGESGSNKITPTKDSATVTFSNVNNSSLKVVNWLESSNSGGTQFRITGITITYAN